MHWTRDKTATEWNQKVSLPDLKNGIGFIRNHYPAGSALIGLWLKVQNKLSEDGVKSLESAVTSAYGNKVCVTKCF